VFTDRGRITGDFHEKAGCCQELFGDRNRLRNADQREAHKRSSRMNLKSPSPNRLASIRTLDGAIAPVPAGVLNLKGCCHLGPELNPIGLGRSFLARAAVTRTRRLEILNAA
jgi:hypothetical protein